MASLIRRALISIDRFIIDQSFIGRSWSASNNERLSDYVHGN